MEFPKEFLAMSLEVIAENFLGISKRILAKLKTVIPEKYLLEDNYTKHHEIIMYEEDSPGIILYIAQVIFMGGGAYQ